MLGLAGVVYYLEGVDNNNLDKVSTVDHWGKGVVHVEHQGEGTEVPSPALKLE